MSNRNAKFIKDLEKWLEAKIKQVEQVVKITAENTTQELIRYSVTGNPEMWSSEVQAERVANGYSPGRFKGSWNVGLGSIPTIGSDQRVDEYGDSALAAASSTMASYTYKVDSVFIVNTAQNPDTGEYYPVILHTKEGTTWQPDDPKYAANLNAYLPELSYDFRDYAELQDGTIAPVARVLLNILQDAVNKSR